MADRDLWSLRVDEARTREALQALEAQLMQIGAPWVGSLRIKIAARRAQLRPGKVAGGVTGEAFAAAYGLPAPDGRWLYRYRVTAEAFEQLQADLAGQSMSGLERGRHPALFVLWASEWFRRCYRGGGHRWVELAGALGMAEDQALFRRITGAGLRAWGRRVIEVGAGSEYLGSLAREGGFPAAAVEDGAGWAQAVLKATVAPLLAEPAAGEERARELASTQRPRLPQLFRDDEFVALCADLALEVVKLRREADAAAAAADLPVAAWLDLNRPDWRQQLPIATSDKDADALVERLLKVEAVSGASVTVQRYLRNSGTGWEEAAQVTLDGALDSAATRLLDPTLGRLRVFAAGDMARSLPGELAMLEAPGDGERGWTARSTRGARGIQPLPFAATIELDLRSGEQWVARIQLAGGKPRRGALIVTEVAEGEADSPLLLRVVGSGSGKYRADTVVLQAPTDWRVEATGEETVSPLGCGVGDTTLWRITGGAFVTDPDDDRFRILCGQPQDEPSRIELIGTHVGWAEVSGNVDLFAGPPIARIGSDGVLCLRAIGTRAWTRAPAPLPIGHYELGWRRQGIVLDRRRIAVLPGQAEVQRAGSPHQPSYRVSGFGACGIDPDEDAPVRVSGDGTWQARPSSRLVHWFAAHIEWPDGPPLSVRINHPTAASIARWDGSVLPNQTHVTLADLPDLVAVNAGRVTMVAELAERGRRVAEMTWEVRDELPMGSVAADVASLLLPASIDAEVLLGMHDGIETWWRVRQFPHELTIENDAAYVPSGLVAEGATLVGRALAAPAEERTFGAYSLLTDANHRPAALPALEGDWLIYLRAGDTVLSRPRYHRGHALAVPRGQLALAMMAPHGTVLDRALLDLLDASDSDQVVIEEVLALIGSLRGLPPATFRVLELLVRRPGVLARLAMAAPAELREAVMALSGALPFAWCTIPRHHWHEALGALFGRLLEQLAMLGADAPRYAKEAVDTVVAALVAREPLLGPVLQPAAAEPIAEITQRFLNRAVDRIPHGHGDRYRRQLPEHLPRYFIDRQFDLRLLDTLDAPCAAAAAVAERWTPRPDDIRHIKTVARTFPTFFAEAFTATLSELS